MADRFPDLQAFWPYYLSEHRNAHSRRLHFVGTTGFLAACAASAAISPVLFPAAMAGFVAIGRRAVSKAEPKRRSLLHVAGMIALPTLASPVLFPAGVAFAYGCAWRGHFGHEKNRPATFEYPVMSLASDLRMWGQMVQGNLWTGDDPAAELGVAEPIAKAG
ncbi:MAG: DUF962 domain-containing protein [Deltaproteobacteria bacterium]|nr:MAG: DUF962 domain-containing protein [Deltaproteobacteria bacterium]